MQALSNNIGRFCLCFLVFVAGVCVGKILFFPLVSMDSKLNPLHLISILTTAFVGIYVGVLVAHDKDKYQTRRALLIEKIRDLENRLRETATRTSRNSVPVAEASQLLKSVGMCLESIEHACDTYKIDMNPVCLGIRAEFSEVRLLMTDTPKVINPGTSAPDIQVIDGEFLYSTARIYAISLCISKAEQIAFQLKVGISEK